MRKPEFLIIWLVPLAIYVATSFTVAYTFLYQPVLCILGLTVCINCCLVLIVWKKTGLGGDRPWYPKLGTFGVIAAVIGSLVGLYVYDTCIIFPQLYGNSRKYTNVLPSQPAAAVADAGKIVFAAGSYVDTTRSVGLVTEDGVKYCIAPVTDGSESRVQFWAVGVGCCGAKGEFYCDDSANPAAKSGIVVFDNNGYFTASNKDLYEKAMLKAMATYSFQTVLGPVYVRWVTEGNLNMLANYYGGKGILTLLIATVVYVLFSLVMALGLSGAPGMNLPVATKNV